jgi:hypothetical protein
MIVIARQADRSPAVAAAIASALQILALVSLPVVGVLAVIPATLSGSVVAYVILRRGIAASGRVLVFAFVGLAIVSIVISGSALSVPLMAVFSWVPVVIAAAALVQTSSLVISVLATTATAIVGVLIFALFVGDVAAWWQPMLDNMLAELLSQRDVDADAAEISAASAQGAAWMTGAAGVSFAASAIVQLFIARHWQAVNVNPGGFRTEFHALSFGKTAALGALAMIAAAAVLGAPSLRAIAMIAGAAFSLQGLAVLHALIASRGLAAGWLIGIYALLIIPQTWLLLAALGLLDNYVPLRRTV